MPVAALALFCGVSVFGLSGASAQTFLVGVAESGGVDAEVMINTDKRAQRLSTGAAGALLDEVRLRVSDAVSDSSTNTLTITVEAESSGVPSGTALATITVTGNDHNALESTGWKTFTFSSPPTLSPNTDYFIVLEYSEAACLYINMAVPADRTLTIYPGGLQTTPIWCRIRRGMLFIPVEFSDFGCSVRRRQGHW